MGRQPCGGRNCPRFKAYCEAHPEYAREALPLLEAIRKAADLRKGERLRSKTHCVNGHLFAENARNWTVSPLVTQPPNAAPTAATL